MVGFRIVDFLVDRLASVLRALTPDLDQALVPMFVVVWRDGGHPPGKDVLDFAVLLSLVSAVVLVLGNRSEIA